MVSLFLSRRCGRRPDAARLLLQDASAQAGPVAGDRAERPAVEDGLGSWSVGGEELAMVGNNQ